MMSTVIREALSRTRSRTMATEKDVWCGVAAGLMRHIVYAQRIGAELNRTIGIFQELAFDVDLHLILSALRKGVKSCDNQLFAL